MKNDSSRLPNQTNQVDQMHQTASSVIFIYEMPEFLTVQEAASALRRSAPTIRRMLKSGALKGPKIGKKFLISEWSVRNLLMPPAESVTKDADKDRK